MDIQGIEKAQQILDRKVWTVEGILGGGTFSFGVFRALEVLSKNYYAVKVVELNSDGLDEYRRREIGLLTKADLSNRNVIRHHHEWTTEVGNTTYLCFKMELCLNNLCDYIRKKHESRVKDENFYKVVFPQILNGLEAIHMMEWVHRDISLTNILVQLPIPRLIRGIKVKIGGFMLARRLSNHRKPSSPLHLSNQATLEKLWPNPRRTLYQAPEMSGGEYCEKADLYSAGIVLYLLASYPEGRESWPDDEIRALREGKRDSSHLWHDHTVLRDLLFSTTCSLLHSDPKCRPSAKEALTKLPLQPEPLRNVKEKNTSLVHAAIAAAQDELELVNDSLGKGSYARVVSVKHAKDDNMYAVKIIRSSPDNPEKYKERELAFLTCQVNSTTMHDNIVRYYNSWDFPVEGEPPALCIRLELCDKNLDDVLKENPEIVYEDVFHKHVFKQILEALHYLHEKNWVHRDIYPRNILIKIPYKCDTISWVVKLTDFGLARELQKPSFTVSDPPMTRLSRNIGNPNYRASEIDTNKAYDCKVDMYSAGLVLYRLCCNLNNEKTVVALQEVKIVKTVNKDLLCRTNEVLCQLMNDLVKYEPGERPRAKEAKKRFSDYINDEKTLLNDIIASALSLDETGGAVEDDDSDDDYKEGELC